MFCEGHSFAYPHYLMGCFYTRVYNEFFPKLFFVLNFFIVFCAIKLVLILLHEFSNQLYWCLNEKVFYGPFKALLGYIGQQPLLVFEMVTMDK